jgi:hypothetical protein
MNLTTGDPRFDPEGPLTVNGYRFVPVRYAQVLLDGVRPFAACVDQISETESDEEWAKFRLLIGDYRRAARALIAFEKDISG